MIELTEDVIDYSSLTESVRDHRAGAVVLFLGTVREFTNDLQTASLTYEAYPEMAKSAMTELEEEVRRNHRVCNVGIVHRIGSLGLGEISVAVAVSAPHRADAFEAGRWLIDTLKERVPVWKQENYVDGSTEWVHPNG
ncbi:MAG: molybdenum cofactor biosynthesis protein MoaE [Planctomycetaceae bacterium]